MNTVYYTVSTLERVLTSSSEWVEIFSPSGEKIIGTASLWSTASCSQCGDAPGDAFRKALREALKRNFFPAEEKEWREKYDKRDKSVPFIITSDPDGLEPPRSDVVGALINNQAFDQPLQAVRRLLRSNPVTPEIICAAYKGAINNYNLAITEFLMEDYHPSLLPEKWQEDIAITLAKKVETLRCLGHSDPKGWTGALCDLLAIEQVLLVQDNSKEIAELEKKLEEDPRAPFWAFEKKCKELENKGYSFAEINGELKIVSPGIFTPPSYGSKVVTRAWFVGTAQLRNNWKELLPD